MVHVACCVCASAGAGGPTLLQIRLLADLSLCLSTKWKAGRSLVELRKTLEREVQRCASPEAAMELRETLKTVTQAVEEVETCLRAVEGQWYVAHNAIRAGGLSGRLERVAEDTKKVADAMDKAVERVVVVCDSLSTALDSAAAAYQAEQRSSSTLLMGAAKGFCIGAVVLYATGGLGFLAASKLAAASAKVATTVATGLVGAGTGATVVALSFATASYLHSRAGHEFRQRLKVRDATCARVSTRGYGARRRD